MPLFPLLLLDDFFEERGVLIELFLHQGDLVHHDERAGEASNDLALRLVDSLGDLDLPFPVQEGDSTHLFEVELDGVYLPVTDHDLLPFDGLPLEVDTPLALHKVVLVEEGDSMALEESGNKLRLFFRGDVEDLHQLVVEDIPSPLFASLDQGLQVLKALTFFQEGFQLVRYGTLFIHKRAPWLFGDDRSPPRGRVFSEAGF